jgi:3-oxoacyl-[acyl-carrier protein] reductase
VTLSPKRTIWITGASSGIGHALALEFGGRDETVVLSGRNESSLKDLDSTIRNHGGIAKVVVCDVRDEQSVNDAVRLIHEEFGTLDVLVNNAGITIFKDFLDIKVQEFDDILRTNLRGAFLTTRAVLPAMIKREKGLILNVVSYAAKTSYTQSSAYAASKAGLAAMMEGLREEVRRKNIKIVNVFPGAVLTPIWHPKVQDKYRDRMMTSSDLSRMIYEISCQPASMMIEDVVIRPQWGDIN